MILLRNRITLAFAGIIIFGVLGAMATMVQLPHIRSNALPVAAVSTATPTAMTDTSATPIASATQTQAVLSTQTPIPTTVLAATKTPTPTQTSTTTTVLQGTIATVKTANGGSFTFKENSGGTVTVIVTSNTRYQGVAGLTDLRTGMPANVTGNAADGGNFVATIVQVQTDN